MQKAYSSGANSFLTKPCNAEDLRNLAKGFPKHFGPLVAEPHFLSEPISKNFEIQNLRDDSGAPGAVKDF